VISCWGFWSEWEFRLISTFAKRQTRSSSISRPRLQHLVNKVVYRDRAVERGERDRTAERGERGKPLVIDAGGFRDKQIERLQTLAQRMAERALTNQEIVELQPMTPHDRRIVHMAIADMPGLSSRSEGEGDDRHILLVPDALA
jgi:predicted RNA-binding protein Jag